MRKHAHNAGLSLCLLEQNTDFADLYSDTTDKWVEYLIKYGNDPENQLCTDDFAVTLPNCNLSLKAIMGIWDMQRFFR